jgi:hypothetical protein
VANTYEEFVAGLEEQIDNDSPEARHKRSDAMEQETWKAKVEAVGEIVRKIRDGEPLQTETAA